MNKKKACIESLAAQEPSSKIPKQDGDTVFEPGSSGSNSNSNVSNSNHHQAANASSLSPASGLASEPALIPDGIVQTSSKQKTCYNQESISESRVSDGGPFSRTNVCSSTEKRDGVDIVKDKTINSHDDKLFNNNHSEHSSQKSPTFMNEEIISHSMNGKIQQALGNITDFFDEKTGTTLTCHPFKHCILPNFIQDTDFVSELETELKNLELQDKNNDLYKFQQSLDLNLSKSFPIIQFRLFLETMREYLSSATGIPLNSKIDLFCSHYRYTDVLLCHDDELEERRIAFIYYLVSDDWSNYDGGTLDLFDADEHGQPKNIVRRILPKRNNFLFFEVSAKSFHQVAEILSENKIRLSLSGWFHGPPLARPTQHKETVPAALSFGSIEEQVFYSWFNPLYLSREVQLDIRKRFEEDSQIELTEFLQVEKYKELTDALSTSTIEWKLVGPANRRNYYTTESSQLPPIVSEYLRVIHSDAAFLVLSNLTGLHLHPFAQLEDEESGANGHQSELNSNGGVLNPRCRSQVRKWEYGCYTLAHDSDTEMMDFALDAIFYIGCEKEWSFENGGHTSYIAKGEDEELLSVTPAANSLALVYRDKDTIGFTKHLNHRVTKLRQPNFYEIKCVFYE